MARKKSVILGFETFKVVAGQPEMPVKFQDDGLTLWAGHNGWTSMSKDEACRMAETILRYYSPSER